MAGAAIALLSTPLLPAGLPVLAALAAVALVATAALTDGSGFAGWARATGVAVAAVAAWLRTPFVVVVLLAAGTTAVLRALGVP